MNGYRSGAALIMAIVILAALLLIGLPFLFSQSAALTGTRTLAHNQAARVGQGTAEQLGIAIAADAMGQSLRAGPPTAPVVDQPWSALYQDIQAGFPLPYDLPISLREPMGPVAPPPGFTTTLAINRIVLRLGAPPKGYDLNPPSGALTSAIVEGTVLEDESGKLDPNDLDVVGWTRLLSKCGISDPDGGDLDMYGELAEALSVIRYNTTYCPRGRIETLETLQKAAPSGSRPALMRAELDRLRRYLSTAVLPQGRQGRIDLGNIISGSGGGPVLDSLTPGQTLECPVPTDLVGAGTSLVVSDSANNLHYTQTTTTSLLNASPYPLIPGDIVTVVPPSGLNINQATMVATTTLNDLLKPPPEDITKPWPYPNTVLGTISALTGMTFPDGVLDNLQGTVHSAFDFLTPVRHYEEVAWGVALQTQPDPSGDGAGVDNDGNPLTPAFTADDGTGSYQPIVSGKPNITIRLTSVTGTFAPSGWAYIEGTAVSGTPNYKAVIYYNSMSWGGVTASLHGISYRYGSAAEEIFAAGSKVTGLAMHELPTLTLASGGCFSIEGMATATGANGKQDAQSARRVLVQGVPQESILERRWTTQGEMHALIASRHGSLMAAAPKPYQRISDQNPRVADAIVTNANPDLATGMRPATLKTPKGTHLDQQWTRTFSGVRDNTLGNFFLTSGGRPYPPTVGLGFDESNLGVEGLFLSGSSSSAYHLSYPLAPAGNNNGFFFYDVTSPGSCLEIAGRQFGIWVKPTGTWSGIVPIFEMRMPMSNVGQELAVLDVPTVGTTAARVTGSNLLQNYFALTYDVTANQLILTCNNAAIEHTHDYGPASPLEKFQSPALGLPTVDPQSFGTDTGMPISPRQPWNNIQYRYNIGKRGSAAGLRPGCWYFIQGVLSSNTPGGMAITVDSMVGRDIQRIPTTLPNEAALVRGDHCTLPALVLRTDLPAGNVKTNGCSDLIVAQIELDGYAPGCASSAAAIAALLPARGMIRIGDEYISYGSIAGTKLMNCVRARRQNTNQSVLTGAANENDRWPQLPVHHIGDLVVPGGYRFAPAGGRLFRGGNKLAQKFWNGDPVGDTINPTVEALTRYTIWGRLNKADPQVTFNAVTGDYTFPGAATSLLLKAADGCTSIASGSTNGFPTRGVIRVMVPGTAVTEASYYYYDPKAGNTLTLADMTIGGWTFAPNAALAPRDLTFKANTEPIVTLISMEVDSAANPLDTGRYRQSDDWLSVIQLMNPVDQRIEWLRYNRIAQFGTLNFFLNVNGFTPDQRGLQRTWFAAEQPGTFWDPIPFEADSRVLPVQNALSQSWMLTTGDIVTILPTKDVDLAKHPTYRPYQVCVRYGATDGFSDASDTASPLWDTNNEWFAFSDELPTDWTIGSTPADPVTGAPADQWGFELVCWPCWSATDLTPVSTVPPDLSIKLDGIGNNKITLPEFLMPWANALDPDFSPSLERRIYIGSEDDRMDADPRLNYHAESGTVATMEGVIDAIHSGIQSGGANHSAAKVLEFKLGANIQLDADGLGAWPAAGPTTGLTDLDHPFTAAIGVTVSQGVFNQTYGLVNIGGEVFAYWLKPVSPNLVPNSSQAILVGRALLGSREVAHHSGESVLVLPIGPVGRLDSALPATTQGGVSLDGYGTGSAAATMLMSPDGAAWELTTFANDRTMAPWLRGLYNSDVKDWAPTGNLKPLAIGWWPRYASAHPDASSKAWTGHENDLMRSRTYSWAGFPIRFHDSYFHYDPGNRYLASVEILDVPNDENGSPMFTLEARALASGFDWHQHMPDPALPVSNLGTTDTGGALKDASDAFGHDQFQSAAGDPIPVEGAEFRVSWRYNNATPTDLYEQASVGNVAPTLGQVRVRCEAPCKILKIESAR